MKVDHVISSIDNSSGGPSRSVTNLVTTLAGLQDEFVQHIHCSKTRDPIVNNFVEPDVNLSFYKRIVLGKLSGFRKNVLIGHNTIFHGHGLWQLPVHQMANLARKRNVPYVISPRGMLKSWSLEQQKFKKKLALKCYQAKDLANAHCLHATSQEEADGLRFMGFNNPIAIIPNGIPLSEFPEKVYDHKSEKKTALFLSRIVENKGIKELIRAWAVLPAKYTEAWNLEVIGNGDPEYIKGLNRLIKIKGLENGVFIKGPLYGPVKVQAYQRAHLFVLPTYSENFGIVVAEALACGTPIITTKGAPWEDVVAENCGWWIETGVDPLVKVLENALTLPIEILQNMGKNGRLLIETKYSMKAVAEQMLAMYKWVLSREEKPDFIRLRD